MSPPEAARPPHWLVTGARGQLGSALRRLLAERAGAEAVSAHGSELDVADPEAVAGALDALPRGVPAVLANAAAFTQVDRCEREPERARRVNAEAPAALAQLCRERGIQLVHVSTDYVFDGEADRPYPESAPPSPRSVYGRSKLEGERAVLEASEGFLVVRTSWVFGRGRNFIAAIGAQLERREREPELPPLRVVDDQRGRPTYAADLAEGLVGLVERGGRGLYHLAGRGEATWWELARAVAERTGHGGTRIERIGTEALDLAAPRPRYSVLDCRRAEAAGVVLRPWPEALDAYLASEDAPVRAASRA